jgi:type I restriction-modification system DNA methylase subunit
VEIWSVNSASYGRLVALIWSIADDVLRDRYVRGTLIEKFLGRNLDLSPRGLDNHGMGTVFEELVRRFNDENNEEAGEQWTPATRSSS